MPKFDELSKIILKLNLCRKELREYDKQFKTAITTATSSTQPSSANCTRKNSTAFDPQTLQQKLYQQQKSIANSLVSLRNQSAHSRNTCFGCTSASVENCVTLFRALLCSNNVQSAGSIPNSLLIDYVKKELCRQGILEELINFNLKRNVLFEIKLLKQLLYHRIQLQLQTQQPYQQSHQQHQQLVQYCQYLKCQQSSWFFY